MIGSARCPADNTMSAQDPSYRSVAEKPLLSIKLCFPFQKRDRFKKRKKLLIVALYDVILCLNGTLKSELQADYIEICEHINLLLFC